MKRPTVITVVAILGFLFYGLRLIYGILVTVGGTMMAQSAGADGSRIMGITAGVGIVMIGFSCFGIAATVRLLHGYTWARSWLMGLSAYILVSMVFRIISGRLIMSPETVLTCTFALVLVIVLNLPSVQDYCSN